MQAQAAPSPLPLFERFGITLPWEPPQPRARRPRRAAVPPPEQFYLRVGVVPIAEWHDAPKPPVVRPTSPDEWEHLLAAEGMPAELDAHHRELPKAPDIAEWIATRVALEEAEPEPEVEDHSRIPWEELVRVARPALLEALETLTPDQRAAVQALLEGARPVDIARKRHVSKPTVTIMLRRARARLAAVLIPIGGAATVH